MSSWTSSWRRPTAHWAAHATARDIAADIVEPVKTRYDEILVHVHQRGASQDAVLRRIQWTPSGGYRELDFAETATKPAAGR